jgi:hypothetical protein
MEPVVKRLVAQIELNPAITPVEPFLHFIPYRTEPPSRAANTKEQAQRAIIARLASPAAQRAIAEQMIQRWASVIRYPIR